MCEHALNGVLTLCIGTTTELADDAFLVVSFEPGGGGGETLGANGVGYSVDGRARAVRVKVLVHLVDDLVLRHGQGSQGRVARRDPGVFVSFWACSVSERKLQLDIDHEEEKGNRSHEPSPCARPRVAFNENVLASCASSADTIDGRMVKPYNKINGRHIIRLIVQSKMTFEFPANWFATVFRHVWKALTSEMTLP